VSEFIVASLDEVSVVNAPVLAVVAPTVPLMLMLAVPVKLVTTPDEGVPRAGLVKLGLACITKVLPVPVCAVTEVALPDEVIGPVRFALVVTLEAVKAVAVPVMFVPTNADGVPSAGVTRVGLFDSTTFVVPVEVVTPVPPLATGKVPVTVVTETAADTHAVPLELSTKPEVLGATEENPVPPELPIMTLLAVTVAEPVPPEVTANGVPRVSEAK
jgi:hypothetical protein